MSYIARTVWAPTPRLWVGAVRKRTTTRHDTRHTTHDTRHTTHDTRHTTHDTRHTTHAEGTGDSDEEVEVAHQRSHEVVAIGRDPLAAHHAANRVLIAHAWAAR